MANLDELADGVLQRLDDSEFKLRRQFIHGCALLILVCQFCLFLVAWQRAESTCLFDEMVFLVAVWAKQFEIVLCSISRVVVAMMHLENLRNLIVATSAALVALLFASSYSLKSGSNWASIPTLLSLKIPVTRHGAKRVFGSSTILHVDWAAAVLAWRPTSFCSLFLCRLLYGRTKPILKEALLITIKTRSGAFSGDEWFAAANADNYVSCHSGAIIW